MGADELVFSARSGTTRAASNGARGRHERTSKRLADLAPEGGPYDVCALAARAVMGMPGELGETPYRDVVCRVVDEDDRPPGPGPGDEAHSPAQAARVLRRALGRSVDRSLGTVRRAAVLAGGGLDSSALLALAVDWARRSGGTVFAMALDFAADGDDRPYLRHVEDALGCEVVRVRPEETASQVSLLAGVDAAPFAWPTAAMEVALMQRARALGAECVLMGVGGDELFDGEPRALAGLARRGHVREAVAAARTMTGFATPRSPMATWVLRPLLAGLVPRALRLHRARRSRVRAPSWAGPELMAYLRRSSAHDVEAAAATIARHEDPAAAAKSADRRYREYLAWGRHAQGVAAGIPRIDPYLDRALLATAAAFPPDWMLHGATRRGLFREAIRALVPDAVRLREDKARFEPALTRFVSAAGGLESFRAWGRGERLAELGVVSGAAFRDAFDEFVANPSHGESWTTLWPALCVEGFLDAEGGARS